MAISCINFPQTQRRKTELEIRHVKRGTAWTESFYTTETGHLQLPTILEFGEPEQLLKNNLAHTFEKITHEPPSRIFRLKTAWNIVLQQNCWSNFCICQGTVLRVDILQEAVPLLIALRADGKVAGPWAFSVSNCLTTLLTGDLLMTLFVEKCLSETTWPETTWHLQVILQLRPLHLWTTRGVARKVGAAGSYYRNTHTHTLTTDGWFKLFGGL